MTVKALEDGRCGVENQYVPRRHPRRQPPGAEAGRRGLRGLRPQVARHRVDSRERLPAARGVPRPSTPSSTFDVAGIAAEESPLCIAGQILQGIRKPQRVPGVRHALHSGAPARRADGLLRGCLRGLLPLREAGVSGSRREAAPEPVGDLALGPVCPLPISEYPTVQLAHGGGGRLTQHADRAHVRAQLREPRARAAARRRGARRRRRAARLLHRFLSSSGRSSFPAATSARSPSTARSTISRCAARGRWRSPARLILEEGLPMETLWRIISSMKAAAAAVGVPIVTGDTKVVDRGKGDGVYINTAGIGRIADGIEISPQARPARRQGPALRRDRRARHRDPVGARRARLRSADRERLGAAARARRGASRRARRAASTCCAIRPAAASPRRSTRSPAGAGVGIRLDEAALAGRRRRCAAPARSSGSIRSTSRTKARRSPSSPARRRTRRWPSGGGIRSAGRRSCIGEVVDGAGGSRHPAQLDRRHPHRRPALRRAAAADLLSFSWRRCGTLSPAPRSGAPWRDAAAT